MPAVIINLTKAFDLIVAFIKEENLGNDLGGFAGIV